MTSIRPDLTNTPEENRTIDTEPISNDARQGRRTVRLTALPEQRRERDPLPPASRAKRRRWRVPVTGDDWLRLAERAFGDLASTLREALLMVFALALVLAAIGIAFGFLAAVVGAIACVVVYLIARYGSGAAHR